MASPLRKEVETLLQPFVADSKLKTAAEVVYRFVMEQKQLSYDNGSGLCAALFATNR